MSENMKNGTRHPELDSGSNIPKLRFPEFVNDMEWSEKSLSEIANFINEKISLDKLTLSNYISTENLLQDFSGVAISSKLPDVKTVTHFKENDILISNIRPYLKKVWSATFDGGASNDVIVVRAKENTNNNFLTYLLKNEEFINYVMQGAKGVKMPRGDISLIKQYPLFISSRPKEQQKIADCLSSFDSLILAQSQKVELLKEHKKGLMQQLFLQDGEEVPKLRFPEFKNAPKWEENPLGSFCSTTTGKLDANAMIENGQYRFYTCAKNYYFIDNYAFDTEALLVSGNGANVGYIHYFKGKFNAYQRTYVLDGFSENIIFIKYYLEHSLHKRIATEKKEGNTPYIVMSTLTDMAITLPKPEEQQKIADFLSSIDEQIGSQTQKLQTLKEHKKALMQQLFPSSEVE